MNHGDAPWGHPLCQWLRPQLYLTRIEDPRNLSSKQTISAIDTLHVRFGR